MLSFNFLSVSVASVCANLFMVYGIICAILLVLGMTSVRAAEFINRTAYKADAKRKLLFKHCKNVWKDIYRKLTGKTYYPDWVIKNAVEACFGAVHDVLNCFCLAEYKEGDEYKRYELLSERVSRLGSMIYGYTDTTDGERVTYEGLKYKARTKEQKEILKAMTKLYEVWSESLRADMEKLFGEFEVVK